ncbi:hypothetical protein GYMLUDRAFT_733617 [Collybiopsis luxurians FD-317 M1]|nr:hypothetical protein GYMLUDRAFT_733617 [Collybiopsis luxurians FD-317 M1]
MPSEEYPNQLYLPVPRSYDTSVDLAQSYSNYSETISSTDTGYLFPGIPTSSSAGELNRSYFGSDGSDDRASHLSSLHDFNIGFSRLQRPADSSFYKADSRLTDGLHTVPVRQMNPPKKQTLACHFCRERKIACGRPAPGSEDTTCNQCARRNIPCTYPTESRRGQHKRKVQKIRDQRLLL